MRVLLIGGSGDTGQRLAARLAQRGCEVIVTSRTPAAAADLASGEVARWVCADPVLDAAGFASAVANLGPLDVAFNLLGAYIRGDPRAVIVDGTQATIAALASPEEPLRYVLCSATSVYGHRPGERLDEDAPLAGDMAIGRIHAESEAIAMRAAGIDPIILRLPHIYGPGRERTFELMCRGEFFVFGDGRNPMHHLHVDDCVSVLGRAADADVPAGIYNVVDDEAQPYGAWCDFITDWCGVARLPRMSFEQALEGGHAARWLGPHMAHPVALRELFAYMTSHAVLDNARMKRHFGMRLRYPSWQDGLRRMLIDAGYPGQSPDA